MKRKLTLVYPQCSDAKRTERLNALLKEILKDYDCKVIRYAEEFAPLKNQGFCLRYRWGFQGSIWSISIF